jgi:Uma2 family endonuclease
MTLRATRLTYEEYLKEPETLARFDIIDGEVIMAAGPSLEHQAISRQLFRKLDPFVIEHGLGEVWFAPLDIIVCQEPLRVRQPDLMFISNENKEIMRERIYGGPDLVVEILSISNSRSYVESKLADYAQIRVKECWLVSPQARTVEILSLVDGAWKRLSLHGLGDSVLSEILPGLELPVSEIFVGS